MPEIAIDYISIIVYNIKFDKYLFNMGFHSPLSIHPSKAVILCCLARVYGGLRCWRLGIRGETIRNEE